MSIRSLSILNDHDNTNRLSSIRSSQQITLELRYSDRREGLEKRVKTRFLPTATIRDVIKEFLKLVNLEHIRPEDVNLVNIISDRLNCVSAYNEHMTLEELSIVDGCTLWFEPLLTSTEQEPLYLTVWASYILKSVIFKWYKNITTLGMLLEDIIKTFSLESIDRERIHLFYDSDELNLVSHHDELLSKLGIKNRTFIDIGIIPPISLTNDRASSGYLSSFDGESSINHSSNIKLNKYITLELQYSNQQTGLGKCEKAQFLPTDTIRDVIKEFLKRAHLEHLRPEDVKLVKFGRAEQYDSIPLISTYKTLKELKIEDGYTLYFEPSHTSMSAISCRLTVTKLNDIGKVTYTWDKNTTTLGMLVDNIINDFSLESIKRKHIRLTKYLDEELNHISNSHRLLRDLGVTDHDLIFIAIVRPHSSGTANEDLNVHVVFDNTRGSQMIDVSYKATIHDLKNQIQEHFEDYHLLHDFILHDRMNNRIYLSNDYQKLYVLGIKPGHTIYAKFRLVHSKNQLFTSNIVNNRAPRTSSLVLKHQPNEVIVNYQFSTFESTKITASIYDTVGELIKKLEALKKNRPFSQFDISCGSIIIDQKKPNRRLTDFGIQSGDIIEVTILDNTSTHISNATNRITTSRISSNLRLYSTPVGLSNLGNTCYMNSALQCLAHAKPLTQFFLNGLTQDMSDDDKYIDTEWNPFYTIGTVTGAYADVLRNLWLPRDTIYYFPKFQPTHLKEIIGLKEERFAGVEQQDAQEFMTFLLDEVHKELKEKNGNGTNTIIEELFFGKIQSTITCDQCKHEEKTTNPISLLSLPLIQQGRIFIIKFIAKSGDSDFTTVTVPENAQVKDLIQAYIDSHHSCCGLYNIVPMADDGPLDLDMPLNQLSITEVTLVEEDKFGSSLRFNRFDKYSKKLTLGDCLREFFSLEHLEDSWLCQQESCKKHTKATKQLQLCSLPPILVIQFKRFSHKDGIREKIDTFVDYPINGLDLSTFISSSNEEGIYDLFAVSKHIGSIYGGHYIACARHEVNGNSDWYKFDDSYVSSFCNDSDIVSQDAYLLFYMKRDKPKQSLAVTTS